MDGPEARGGQPSWRACEPVHKGQTKCGEVDRGHSGIIPARLFCKDIATLENPSLNATLR